MRSASICNQPIRIGSAEILPGDILCADNDGVLVLQAGSLEAVITRAEEIEHWESRVFSAISTGVSYEQAVMAAGEMP